MIAMEPEGSTEGFLRKKIVPAITVFELVSTLLFTVLRNISAWD